MLHFLLTLTGRSRSLVSICPGRIYLEGFLLAEQRHHLLIQPRQTLLALLVNCLELLDPGTLHLLVLDRLSCTMGELVPPLLPPLESLFLFALRLDRRLLHCGITLALLLVTAQFFFQPRNFGNVLLTLSGYVLQCTLQSLEFAALLLLSLAGVLYRLFG